MESAIDDEITSINSIYGDETLVLSSRDPTVCLLRLPAHTSTVLRLEFPRDYPDAPPSVAGIETVGDDLPKGAGHKILELVRDVLSNVYKPGEACVYDLLEDTGEALSRHALLLGNAPDDGSPNVLQAAQPAEEDLGPEPPWILSDPISEKKSVFVGRAAVVNSTAQAQQYLRHLLHTDKKVRNATHNINAWRIQGVNGVTYQDCDDDGETAAGGRVLHLMQLMDVWNVMVVVTRWYGGILLGPDRFRLINSAARDALVKAGFSHEAESGSKKKSKK
ncbi:uncharacterized protein PV09_02177 [Verruconis gallopava]|uniref:RWD domain-containing protein n=1 Tax=Verruconis gallopava TaxID=253628 RepID=A0A0D1Z304_9PEZI|nr:uncharacterized protein PV09_02177 [Verruconis gallopava]KIW07327.1 hypothetical protein PV09_02177 [Verruconis gallopava]